MRTTVVLTQEDIANILAATLETNRMIARDIAFSFRDAEGNPALTAVIQVDSDPLQVRTTPEPESYTEQLIEKWRRGR